MRRLLRAASLAGLLGCSGAPADPGLEALLRVEGGSFYPGAMPGDTGGPRVEAVELLTNIVRPGMVNKPLRGALAPEANAAAISLAGDVGHWIVTAGVPDVSAPELPTFDVDLSFSPALPFGAHELVVRAVDDAGRFGPPSVRPLSAPRGDAASGELVVSLGWDTNADLDLHVVDPRGVEIWKRNTNSWEPPPGEPVDPEAWKSGARLDFDANARCVIDGRRQENVVWSLPPPAGRYVVRVDTFSLCGEPAARWTVDVVLRGALLARAEGLSTAFDTRAPHDLGAGVLAIVFEVP